MSASFPFKIKLAITLAIILWASAFVGIRAGLTGYSPGSLALFRFIIASFCIGLVYQKQGKHLPVQRNDLILIVLTGVIGIGLYNILLNIGEKYVPSGMASFIVSQSPIVSTLLAVFFLRERMSWFGVIGMAISILGVILIAFAGNHEFKFYLSIFYVISAMVVGSFYSILQKNLLKKYHAIDLTAYAIWSGTLILLIFLPQLCHEIRHAPLQATLATLYLGIFPAALAYLAWGYVLSEIPASRAVSFLYFSPILATFIGWLWLGEVPTMLSILGGFVALSGVVIVNRSYKKI